MQDDSTKIAPTGTQTLLRGLAVVQAVANGARDLKDIARVIGTTRSTTHRLASCLVDERYLRVLPKVGYLLGPKLIELGFQAREELPLVTLAEPYLDQLSALTGDTIHLAVREGDEVLYLHKNPGRNGPEMRSRVGHRMAMARTGIGKARPCCWMRPWTNGGACMKPARAQAAKIRCGPIIRSRRGSSSRSACAGMWREGMRLIWKTTNRRSAV